MAKHDMRGMLTLSKPKLPLRRAPLIGLTYLPFQKCASSRNKMAIFIALYGKSCAVR
jgi:hypothetical protein